jgi:hypothetical protein
MLSASSRPKPATVKFVALVLAMACSGCAADTFADRGSIISKDQKKYLSKIVEDLSDSGFEISVERYVGCQRDSSDQL